MRKVFWILMVLMVLMVLSAPAWAQYQYVLFREATPAAAASVVTVQQPATGARNVRLVSIYVYCAVDCGFSLERDGTAATTTASTPTPMNSSVPVSKATGFHTSDVGTGVTLAKFSLVAKSSIVLSASNGGLGNVSLTGQGTGKNITVRSSSISGLIQIAIMFTEQ